MIEVTNHVGFQQLIFMKTLGPGFIPHNPSSTEWVSSPSGLWNPSKTNGLSVRKISGSWSRKKRKNIFLNSFSAIFFQFWSDIVYFIYLSLHDGTLNLLLQLQQIPCKPECLDYYIYRKGNRCHFGRRNIKPPEMRVCVGGVHMSVLCWEWIGWGMCVCLCQIYLPTAFSILQTSDGLTSNSSQQLLEHRQKRSVT